MKCKRLMFELDFSDLEQGEDMDRPNPRLSDPGPHILSAHPELGPHCGSCRHLEGGALSHLLLPATPRLRSRV